MLWYCHSYSILTFEYRTLKSPVFRYWVFRWLLYTIRAKYLVRDNLDQFQNFSKLAKIKHAPDILQLNKPGYNLSKLRFIGDPNSGIIRNPDFFEVGF